MRLILEDIEMPPWQKEIVIGKRLVPTVAFILKVLVQDGNTVEITQNKMFL